MSAYLGCAERTGSGRNTLDKFRPPDRQARPPTGRAVNAVPCGPRLIRPGAIPGSVPRRTGSAVFLVVALIVTGLAVASAVVLALEAHPSVSLPAPQVGPTIQLADPTVNYSTQGAWYNFTIASVVGNFTWNHVDVLVQQGRSLHPLDENSTVTLVNRTAGTSEPFVRALGVSLSLGNWTSPSPTLVSAGQQLVLCVDHLEFGASIDLAWTGPARGDCGWTPLPS